MLNGSQQQFLLRNSTLGTWSNAVWNQVFAGVNDTILDDIWAWRTDHGSGVGRTSNTATNGMIVNSEHALGDDENAVAQTVGSVPAAVWGDDAKRGSHL